LADTADKRILWRCRRGTRELDLVLEAYATQAYPDLDAGGKVLFAEMLELQDTRLIEWLVYRRSPDPRYAAMVAEMLRLQDGDRNPEITAQ